MRYAKAAHHRLRRHRAAHGTARAGPLRYLCAGTGPQPVARLRARGLKTVWGDLDRPYILAALAGLAHDVVHFARPPPTGSRDTRTGHLIAALAKGKSLPQHLVYISTSGVYGDCGLSNRRLKRELRVALRYPSVHEGLAVAGKERRI